VAHLGYFQAEFVERRQWLDARSYADLVALCQFLPGPASSQVGMALGLQRAGWLGALLAWIGFTMPSACLLIVFAYGILEFSALAVSGAVHGLKVVAVSVVALAVGGMAKTLCPDRLRAGFAIVAALLALLLPSAAGQIAALLACGLAGRLLLSGPGEQATSPLALGVSRKAGVAALAVFLVLLLALPFAAIVSGESAAPSARTDLAVLWTPIEGFYRAGALVFGGGHVVLPLLQAVVVPEGLVSNAAFLAGYGAAQAVPGPLFCFAAYLGAVMEGPLRGWAGGLFFLVVIFLPAFLLVVGVLPFWDLLRNNRAVRSAMAGVNAGVVGLLLSALYDPVFTTAIRGVSDFGLALAAFGLLAFARVSPVIVVALGAGAGWALG
jgi:chromate transporter